MKLLKHLHRNLGALSVIGLGFGVGLSPIPNCGGDPYRPPPGAIDGLVTWNGRTSYRQFTVHVVDFNAMSSIDVKTGNGGLWHADIPVGHSVSATVTNGCWSLTAQRTVARYSTMIILDASCPVG